MMIIHSKMYIAPPQRVSSLLKRSELSFLLCKTASHCEMQFYYKTVNNFEPPSQQSGGIGSPGPPTLADRDLLDRRGQGQVGTARPERRINALHAIKTTCMYVVTWTCSLQGLVLTCSDAQNVQ